MSTCTQMFRIDIQKAEAIKVPNCYIVRAADDSVAILVPQHFPFYFLSKRLRNQTKELLFHVRKRTLKHEKIDFIIKSLVTFDSFQPLLSRKGLGFVVDQHGKNI